MRRATYTQFRNPRERTPSAAFPQVTSDGTQLFSSQEYKIRTNFKTKISKSKRFDDYLRRI